VKAPRLVKSATNVGKFGNLIKVNFVHEHTMQALLDAQAARHSEFDVSLDLFILFVIRGSHSSGIRRVRSLPTIGIDTEYW
jgi:hypothetical protein